MAKIILKSRYLRAGSRRHSEHLIHYIAKREGVQKIDDTWKHRPATVEQQKGNTCKFRLPQNDSGDSLQNSSVTMASVRLISQLARIFEERLRGNEDSRRRVLEKKLRQKIEEKKQAHGMKMV